MSTYYRTSLFGFSCTIRHLTLTTILRGRDYYSHVKKLQNGLVAGAMVPGYLGWARGCSVLPGSWCPTALFSAQGPFFFSHGEGRTIWKKWNFCSSSHITVKWHKFRFFPLFSLSLWMCMWEYNFFPEPFEGNLHISFPLSLSLIYFLQIRIFSYVTTVHRRIHYI